MKHRRTTVYFDPEIFTALRRRAADSDRTLSNLIDEAVRLLLAIEVKPKEVRKPLSPWEEHKRRTEEFFEKLRREGYDI